MSRDEAASEKSWDWSPAREEGPARSKLNRTNKNAKACYNGIVVVQNTLGLTLDIAKVEKLAKKYKLAIIEDLAHCAGRFYPDGREVGTVGAAVALSFGKGKAIDTIEGGACVLRDKKLEFAERPSQMPKLGDRLRDRFYPLLGALMRGGHYFRAQKLLAGAFLKLGWIQRSADAELNENVTLLGWQAKLAKKQLANLPKTPLREHELVHDRDELLQQLAKSGACLNEIWYDVPVSPARYAAEADFPAESCPNTMRVAAEIINLPTWYKEEKLAPVKAEIKDWQATTSPEILEMWTKICQKFPEANFLQSPAWGRANQLCGHEVVIKTFGGKAWCLMIMKKARRGRYLEVPGGPLMDWGNKKLTAEVFAEIRRVAKLFGCVFVRMRPQLRMSEQNLTKLQKLGAKKAPFHLHAEHTVILDLTKSEDDLLAEMRRQTRYEVRQAEKKGLTVEWANDAAIFAEFQRTQAATAARQHFVPPSLKVLEAERRAFGDQARIYVAKTPDGEPIAYGLILIDGAEAEYFEGASTDLGRKFPGAYAMLWRAMRDLKELGVKRFNLWGIAPPGVKGHRYASVTTFKTGFGGETVEFVPAHDLVLKPLRYQITRLIENLRKKRRHL